MGVSELHPLVIALGSGQVALLVVVVWFLIRWDRRLTVWTIEHTMLLDDYCQRHGITQLPTRKVKE